MAASIAERYASVSSAAVICLVGVLDDLFELPPLAKFAGQIFAAGIAVACAVADADGFQTSPPTVLQRFLARGEEPPVEYRALRLARQAPSPSTSAGLRLLYAAPKLGADSEMFVTMKLSGVAATSPGWWHGCARSTASSRW